MSTGNELHVNERSEGGFLITQMNLLFAKNDWNYASAVGELSLKSNHATDTRNVTLFPDAVIYQDQKRLIPVMGWEFKMPDTPIDNKELISNARDKANRMGTEVFVLWNFQYCAVYYRNQDRSWPTTPSKLYDECADTLVSRRAVGDNEQIWQQLLGKVLSDLNRDYVNKIYDVAPIEFHISDYVDTITKKLAPITSSAYLKIMRPQFRAEVREWYLNDKAEFSANKSANKLTDEEVMLAFAKNVVIRWVNRILFCNLIRKHQNLFSKVLYDFHQSSDIKQFASELNDAISTTDFYSILHVNKNETQIPKLVISDLVDFNNYLWQADMSDVSANFISKSLESMVTVTKRELMGLYTTPQPLAELLVNLTLVTAEGNYADVTVGSGTIAKVLLNKLISFKSLSYIHEHLWLSDKYSYPLQAANMNITSVNSLNLMNIVFRHNALSLKVGEKVYITNPQTGKIDTLIYPKMDTITSNLPFVSSNNRSEDDRILISRVNSSNGLTARADLYQSILLHLKSLLSDNPDARAGVIVSNSWMKNTAKGSFFDVLVKLYDIDSIVYSNVAKWFDNASVVATILILKKKSNSPEKMKLIGLNVDIRSMELDEVDQLSDRIIAGTLNSTYELNEYTPVDAKNLMSTGISLEGLFDDISWLDEIIKEKKLTTLSNIVNITRGTRTGRDKLYVTDGLLTDKTDSFPYVKTLKGLSTLTIKSSGKYLFYTIKTPQELKDAGHLKTLRYMKSKENDPEALKERLTKGKGEAWYIPDDKPRYGDYVTSMNPNQHLFWAAFEEPTAFNQRGVAASLKSEYQHDRELIHALLNSAISLFILGASGFSRAQGVTDLTSDGLKHLSILNPSLLTDEKKQVIVDAWHTVVNSSVVDIVSQLQQKSWIAFNKVVLEQFNIDVNLYPKIVASITRIMTRRKMIGGS